MVGFFGEVSQSYTVTILVTSGSLTHTTNAGTCNRHAGLKDGSFDGAHTFYKEMGLAIEFGGGHARINPEVALGKLVFLCGARFAIPTSRKDVTVFGEALFGAVHGFDSLFPAGASTALSANCFHVQIGGGVNWRLQHGLGVRPLEIDYVHSALPNNSGNSQNDFRVGFGIFPVGGKQ